MKLEIRTNGVYAFVRAGRFEVHLERHSERAPEGWLSVSRTTPRGEVVLSVGRWALHGVNHNHLRARYAAQ